MQHKYLLHLDKKHLNFKLLTFYEFPDQTFFLIHMYDPYSCIHNDPTNSMQTDKGY